MWTISELRGDPAQLRRILEFLAPVRAGVIAQPGWAAGMWCSTWAVAMG